MRFLIVYIVFAFVLSSCNRGKEVKTLNGYVVYILPENIRFVETKEIPDTAYEEHFASENFNSGISFKPNCLVEKIIDTIKPDTLLDENRELKEFATFMKKPLVFPAKITVFDTSQAESTEPKKFKMLYRGKNVEFSFVPFNGIVIDLKRIQ